MLRFLTASVCGLVGFALTIATMAYLGQIPEKYVNAALDRVPVELAAWSRDQLGETAVDTAWPPQLGELYPDPMLTNQYGEPVRLSDFAGKVILVELAAIPCEGCQAFAGGNRHGGFGGFEPQSGLGSIHEYAKRFAEVELRDHEDVVFVQLLLYGRQLGRPTPEEVGGWASHFKMNDHPNLLVLRGDESMLGPQTQGMVPGFHLIDRDFVLRFDSGGPESRHDLYQDLLPGLGELVRAKP